ncbi:MAG: zinc ribbon domain-containing protein, partial [Verrucomicrobiota bacterium]
MNPFRLLATQPCPKCDSRLSKDARYCSTCGYGNENEWRSCYSCGVEVGADSNFCWSCQEPLADDGEGRVWEGVWKRQIPEVAVKFPLRFPEHVVESHVTIADGTRGALVIEEVVEEELPRGTSRHLPEKKFLDRVFALEGFDKKVEALLYEANEFSVPIHINHEIQLNNGVQLSASMELLVRISDVQKLHIQLVQEGSRVLTTNFLIESLHRQIRTALGNELSKHSPEDIRSAQYDVPFFDKIVRSSVETRLEELGFTYLRLEDIAIEGDFLTEMYVREAQDKLRKQNLEAEFSRLQEEHEFGQFRKRLESEGRLKDAELVTLEAIFRVRSDEDIRKLERISEQNEQEHQLEMLKGQ